MGIDDRLKVNAKILDSIGRHAADPKLNPAMRKIADSIVNRELIELEIEWLGESSLNRRGKEGKEG